MKRLAGLIGRLLLFLAVSLAMAEGLLRLGSLFVHGRGASWRPGARVHVLCLGDSHTYGGGVPVEDSYPDQLQHFLDERNPARYAVVNLGVPGMSTTQVRNRLPLNVGRFHPDLIIFWCGINDIWNRKELPLASDWRLWLDGLASHLRVYQFVRVWLHDRNLEHSVGAEKDGTRYVVHDDRPPSLTGPQPKQTVHWGNVVEHIRNENGGIIADAAMQQRVQRDFEAMIGYAHAAGIPVIAITYPIDRKEFALVNQAIRRAADHLGVPVVNSTRSLQRVPKDKQIWGWAVHPTGPIYREIARDVADAVVSTVEQRKSLDLSTVPAAAPGPTSTP